MISKVKPEDFDFKYTGNNFTEKEIIIQGYVHLSGKELLTRISNKTIFGEYPMGYKFVTDIYENGTTNGVNQVGSVDNGNWKIDFEKNTLQLEWKNGWVNTVTRAYLVNENIEFYDTDTGKWRTTFKVFENWKEE
jgi:hypothetical protein